MTEVSPVRLKRLQDSFATLAAKLADASPTGGGQAAMLATIRLMRAVAAELYELETAALEAAYVDAGISYRELGAAYGGRRDVGKPMITQNMKRELEKRGIAPQGQRPTIQKTRGPRKPKAA